MIKIYEKTEINEISRLLENVGALPREFVIAYLEKKRKSPQQIHQIINQMIKCKNMFLDKSRNYFMHYQSNVVPTVDQGKIKALWLYLALFNSIKFSGLFIQCDEPRVLTFQDINCKDTENPFYDVFYIPIGQEFSCCSCINKQFSTLQNGKAYIIIDDISQIEKIRLSDNLSISAFAIAGADGNVLFSRKEHEHGTK